MYVQKKDKEERLGCPRHRSSLGLNERNEIRKRCIGIDSSYCEVVKWKAENFNFFFQPFSA